MKKQYLSIWIFLYFTVIKLQAQAVQYLPLFTDATFSKGVNTTAPVGFTKGSLDVSASGGVTYTIPIDIPPGTKGVSPSLVVTYNSQAGNGLLGMGWNLGGISAISRVTKDIINDGKVEPVSLTNTDVFALDGNKLVVLAGTNGSDGATYGTKLESFSLITSNGSSNGGPDWFKVFAKNGMTYEYGHSVDSKFTLYNYPGPTNIGTGMWYLNKAYDQYGNYIEYKYTRVDDEIRLSEILYTGNTNAGLVPYNRIAFSYALREDFNVGYVLDAPIESHSVLTEISVTTENAQLVKKYNFNFGSDGVHSFLREVVETGSDGTQLNSTIFKYGNPPSSQGTVVTSTEFVGEIVSKGDFNGDGFTDILTAIKNTNNVYTSFKVYINNANGTDFRLAFTENLTAGFLIFQLTHSLVSTIMHS